MSKEMTPAEQAENLRVILYPSDFWDDDRYGSCGPNGPKCMRLRIMGDGARWGWSVSTDDGPSRIESDKAFPTIALAKEDARKHIQGLRAELEYLASSPAKIETNL